MRWAVPVLLLAGLLTACGRAELPEVGQPAPELRFGDTLGREVALSDLRGQVVLLNFWSIWCLPCHEEIPVFESVQGRYEDRGFAVVLVEVGDELEDVVEFMVGEGHTLPSLVDAAGTSERVYGIDAVPTSVLIDADGVVRQLWVGVPVEEGELVQQIELLLP
jgi:peroxiredoxin